MFSKIFEDFIENEKVDELLKSVHNLGKIHHTYKVDDSEKKPGPMPLELGQKRRGGTLNLGSGSIKPKLKPGVL